METNLKMFLGAAMILLLVSCVKDPRDIPGGFDDNPEFHFVSSFGSDSLILAAGVNQWTMLPNTYLQDNKWVFGATFSKNGCVDNCSPSITFTFYQNDSDLNSVSGIFNETITSEQKEFVTPSEITDSFQLSFTTHPGLFMNGLSYWEDLNSPPPSYFPVYQNQVGPNDGVHVCFQSQQYTGCQYVQCMSYIPSVGHPCIAYIEPALENSNFVRLIAKPTGTPPFKYLWQFGDSTQTTFVPYNPEVTSIYTTVTITDAIGSTTELSQLVQIRDGFVDPCYFPIEIHSERVPSSYETAFADKVAVSLMDPSGSTWSSNLVQQNDESFFSIHSIEEFIEAPNGQFSYKVMVSGKLLLFNSESGETKPLEFKEAVIALSHP